MGMYADHGVEYWVVLKNGERIRIASTKDTDERLLQSRFYADRKDTWLSGDTLYGRGCFMDRITCDIDMVLTDQEKIKLDSLLQAHPHEIVDHGWFDVNSISSTMW